MEMRPMKPEERNFSYTQDSEKMRESGCIGHLRGYFEKGSETLYTSWDNHSKELLTDRFKSELNEVVTALRKDKDFGMILKSQKMMSAYRDAHPEASFGDGSANFGIRADTKEHSYMIRCNPNPGEYSVYIYAYDRKMLDAQLAQPEVYRYSASYAMEHGELNLWRKSKELNIACRDAIDNTVAENFDGWHLPTKKVLTSVVNEFGKERVELVLAATIQEKIYDGRFSKSNKEWAAGIPMIDGDKCYMVSDQTHSVLIDALAKAFRESYPDKKPSVVDQLKSSAAKTQSTVSKKSEPER